MTHSGDTPSHTQPSPQVMPFHCAAVAPEIVTGFPAAGGLGGLLGDIVESGYDWLKGLAISHSDEITPRPDLPALSGGRSGGDVKDLTGPPNSAISGQGDRIYITDENGNVVVDVTPDRAKNVVPG